MNSTAVGVADSDVPPQRAWTSSGGHFRDFSSGQYLFRQDEPGDCAYFIESGVVEVLHRADGVPGLNGSEPTEILISRASPGELLGELSLIDGEPRMASARAASPVRVRVLDNRQLAEKIERADPLLRHLLRVNLRRYRHFASRGPGEHYLQREDDEDRHKALEMLASEHTLERAIRNGEMELHYQPIVVSATAEVAGFEALVRWRHPERGLLLPAHFIPLAESSRLIGMLGAWVMREGAVMAARLAGLGRDLFVNLNLSPSQFDDPGLADVAIAAARDAGAPMGSLRLEITESLLMSRGDQAVGVLDRLRAEGFKIAIDDFGTGYSSLARLYILPVDILKFDRFLIQAAEKHAGARVILTALVRLAGELGMTSVGEGVESDDQARMLRDQGVDFAQGYYFGRAMPAVEAMALAGGTLESEPASL